MRLRLFHSCVVILLFVVGCGWGRPAMDSASSRLKPGMTISEVALVFQGFGAGESDRTNLDRRSSLFNTNAIPTSVKHYYTTNGDFFSTFEESWVYFDQSGKIIGFLYMHD